MSSATTKQMDRESLRRADAQTQEKLSLSGILDNPYFPAPPGLALQIVDKASQPDCNPNEILELLKRDPGLCGRVFKMVNSSVFGLGRPIASLERAVLVLGIKPLRSLVLGMSLPAIQSRDHDELFGQYWRESVGGAVIARELAMFMRRSDPDDDFLAALLRDLGIHVLQQIFTDDYRAVWTKCRRGKLAEQCERERAAFGIDHAETSCTIMESWRMPSEISLPIRYHHDPSRLPKAPKNVEERAWLLCFASQVARLDLDNMGDLEDLLKLAQSRFGMDQSALTRFLEGVGPKIRDLASILQVEIGQCPNFSAIIAAGCEELVKLSVEKSRPSAPQPPAPSRPLANPRTAPAGPEFDISSFDAETGAVLDGYTIQNVVGRGAMGVVYKAFDPSLQRIVAIKLLKPERLVNADARNRFLREARASAAIQHQNVVTIYAVSEYRGLPYLVMEYLEGISLQDRLDQKKPIPIADVISYAYQLAAGLQAAHAKKVIHRDIKPANIVVVNATGVVKITDFGLARVQDGVCVSQAGQLVGTPLYMSPEQFSGAAIDHRADLFSFGSLLYALCVGTPPFDADSVMALMRKVADSRPISLKIRRPEVPMWLENVISKLHAKLPSGRFASAGEVMQAIESHANLGGRRMPGADAAAV